MVTPIRISDAKKEGKLQAELQAAKLRETPAYKNYMKGLHNFFEDND